MNADPGPATQINADPDPKPCFFELFSSKNAIYVCPIGYSGFNNLMGFTSKKLPYIILNNVYLESFLKELAISCEFVL